MEENHEPIIILAAILLFILFAIFGAYFLMAAQTYREAVGWFYSLNWAASFYAIRAAVIILNVALIGFIAFTLKQYSALSREAPKTAEPIPAIAPKDEVFQNWSDIRALVNSPNPSDWNMAILRADALLDDVLQDLRYEGPALSDRLRIVDPTKLPSLERIWTAHRLRNVIAHEPLEQRPRETIIEALRAYEQAFRELGLLS